MPQRAKTVSLSTHSSLFSSHFPSSSVPFYYFVYLAIFASSPTPIAANASYPHPHHREQHRSIAAKSRRTKSNDMTTSGEKPQVRRLFFMLILLFHLPAIVLGPWNLESPPGVLWFCRATVYRLIRRRLCHDRLNASWKQDVQCGQCGHCTL